MSSQILSTFSVVCWCLVTLNICHVQLTLDRPLNENAIKKTTIRLKECSPKAPRSNSRVSVGDLPSLMQDFMQTRCYILPSITDKTKYKVEKALV
jgi:hypothetical protein